MKNFSKKILSVLLILSLCIFPVTRSEAATSGRVSDTITFRITGDTLYIEGTGEIPDYYGVDYLSRPWNGQSYSKVNIAPTITRIGLYAFANNPYLTWIDIYSTTFVANNTCFAGSNGECIMRIHGNAPTYKALGPVTYSSWESMAAGSPIGPNNIFILDDETSASQFRTVRYPYYLYVYAANAEDHPWTTRKTYFNDGAFKIPIRLENLDGFATVSSSKGPASEAFMKNIGDYLQLYNFHYMATYELQYYEKGQRVMTATNKTRKYILTLPTDMQVPGVNFMLLQICSDGSVNILSDMDTSIKTLTFATANPSGTYILIY